MSCLDLVVRCRVWAWSSDAVSGLGRPMPCLDLDVRCRVWTWVRLSLIVLSSFKACDHSRVGAGVTPNGPVTAAGGGAGPVIVS